MKFTKHLLLVSFLLLQSASALAANWVQVEAADERQLFIELESISRIGNKVQCWVNTNYDEPQTEKYPIDDNNNKYSSSLFFYEFDCYNRTYDIVEIIEYSEKERGGTVIKNLSYPSSKTPSKTPSRIPPGTVAESLMKFACQQSKKK